MYINRRAQDTSESFGRHHYCQLYRRDRLSVKGKTILAFMTHIALAFLGEENVCHIPGCSLGLAGGWKSHSQSLFSNSYQNVLRLPVSPLTIRRGFGQDVPHLRGGRNHTLLYGWQILTDPSDVGWPRGFGFTQDKFQPQPQPWAMRTCSEPSAPLQAMGLPCCRTPSSLGSIPMCSSLNRDHCTDWYWQITGIKAGWESNPKPPSSAIPDPVATLEEQGNMCPQAESFRKALYIHSGAVLLGVGEWWDTGSKSIETSQRALAEKELLLGGIV